MAVYSRIELEFKSLMPEKFLNVLSAAGVRIIKARRADGRSFFITTDALGGDKVMELAEKYGLECRKTRVSGWKRATAYLSARSTLPAAFIIMGLCLGFFLTRIWIVDVRCLGGTLPAGVEECLQGAGVKTGAYANGLDTHLLALELSALEGAAYASAAREGVALVVEIAGEDASPEVYDFSRARDLVALCDGVISSVEVKSGTAMVKEGDTVRRGQVLIAGEERISAEENRFVGALGSVHARIWAEGTAEESLMRTEKEFTGRKSASADISAAGYSFPIARGEEFEHAETVRREITVGGLFVPIKIIRTQSFEYVPRFVHADREDISGGLGQRAIAAAEANLSQMAIENTEIIDKWIDFSMIDTDTLCARAVIEFTADIAVTCQYLEEN